MRGLSLRERAKLPISLPTWLLWGKCRAPPPVHSAQRPTTRPRALPQTLEASWSVLTQLCPSAFCPYVIHSVTMKNREESKGDSLSP